MLRSIRPDVVISNRSDQRPGLSAPRSLVSPLAFCPTAFRVLLRGGGGVYGYTVWSHNGEADALVVWLSAKDHGRRHGA